MTNTFHVATGFMVLAVAAAAPRTAEAADPALNVGSLQVVGGPDMTNFGAYGYAAGSLVFPIGPGMLIPGAGVEFCPEFSRWGFVGTMVFDVPLSRHMGVDVLASFVHDQSGGHWGDAIFQAGGGVGMSFFLGKFVLSPSVSLLEGVNIPGWSIVPTLNLSHGLAF